MPDPKPKTVDEVIKTLLDSRIRKGKLSRNTIAVGLVVLDTFREKCPLKRSDILSSGGEIKGSRSGLWRILQKYGIPRNFLKEATTRQAHQDGMALLDQLQSGSVLTTLSRKQRDEQLLQSIQLLQGKAADWLKRQKLKISCDHQLSPVAWLQSILKEGIGKSGGKVEQHLVGAKLQTRHPNLNVPNHPGYAGDMQTGRSADFEVGSISYHVTAAPTRDVIEKCRTNAAANRCPVSIVPERSVLKAKHLAEDEGIADRVTILGLEDFIAHNVIEIATQHGTDFYTILVKIVAEYNRRIEEVETDMALKIELG